jgi:hypothetical protein
VSDSSSFAAFSDCLVDLQSLADVGRDRDLTLAGDGGSRHGVDSFEYLTLL